MDQKNHNKSCWKKLLAPVMIAGVLVIYYVVIAAVFFLIPDIVTAVKILLAVIPLSLAGVMFAMLLERVKEIRSGEEDDLSKY